MPGQVAAESVPVNARNRRREGSYWFDIVFGRLIPALFFSVFIVDKLLLVVASWSRVNKPHTQASDYLDAVDQLLGLAYFTMIVALYVVRLPKRAGDARPLIIAASFIGSFSVIAISFLPGVTARSWLLAPASILIVLGLGYTLWALSYLRRSFSIIPEARRLVIGGPYALSRHPLYLGEGTAAVGLYLPTIGPLGLIGLAIFLGAQYVRIRAEERVLEREFPEYGEYRRRVPRYAPDPVRLIRNLRRR
jgi:protein-S-isoprenylcysteine O-methyltransferase Ste14